MFNEKCVVMHLSKGNAESQQSLRKRLIVFKCSARGEGFGKYNRQNYDIPEPVNSAVGKDSVAKPRGCLG
jgi:hypothetical protein